MIEKYKDCFVKIMTSLQSQFNFALIGLPRRGAKFLLDLFNSTIAYSTYLRFPIGNIYTKSN